MTNPHDILEPYVADGTVPGAVGLLARGDRVEVQAVGSADLDGGAPMARDSIFRIASITKPITAAAVMLLVDDGRLALDDPVERWLRDVGELFLEGATGGSGARERRLMWSRPPARSPSSSPRSVRPALARPR